MFRRNKEVGFYKSAKYLIALSKLKKVAANITDFSKIPFIFRFPKSLYIPKKENRLNMFVKTGISKM